MEIFGFYICFEDKKFKEIFRKDFKTLSFIDFKYLYKGFFFKGTSDYFQ